MWQTQSLRERKKRLFVDFAEDNEEETKVPGPSSRWPALFQVIGLCRLKA